MTLCLICLSQGQKTEAERYFLKAIQLDPTKGNCYMHYGKHRFVFLFLLWLHSWFLKYLIWQFCTYTLCTQIWAGTYTPCQVVRTTVLVDPFAISFPPISQGVSLYVVSEGSKKKRRFPLIVLSFDGVTISTSLFLHSCPWDSTWSCSFT